MKIRANLNKFLLISFCLLTMPCTGATGGTIYVDADASGANNGSSWTDAFIYLQDALAVAVSGDEIQVAAGFYKPDEDTAHPTGTGDRTATFQLITGVAIHGGVTGGESVLSGDLTGDDIGFTNNGENSYHVVTGSGTDETAILDGFTITAGNANSSWPNSDGGGMFTWNRHTPWATNPTVKDCEFIGNSAISGGGMGNSENGNPIVTNCIFSGNSGQGGGGLFNHNSRPKVTACIFSCNSATNGGGMDNCTLSNPVVTNCTFIGNSASDAGGGICNGESTPTVANCTFSTNSASRGGGMFNWMSNPTVVNCVLWGDTPDEVQGDTPSITYSDIQAGTGQPWFSTGCIDADPLFIDVDLRLSPGSPCINSGANSAVPPSVTTDLDGNTRIFNEIVDMGAYELQVASIITVNIDIKPGSDMNPINQGANGLIPVAILSSDDFDATTVIPASVLLGSVELAVRGEGKLMAHKEDVDGDGLTDLVVQVETQAAGLWESGDIELTAETTEGLSIVGYDEILIVPLE